MSLGELALAFTLHRSVIVYALLAIAGGAYAATAAQNTAGVIAAAVIAALIYPLVWYILHRFVLHSRLLYKHPVTAPLWKRIHYDHHQDPRDLRVLFGALYTTLPTIAIIVGPIGFLLGGLPGAAAGFASGVLMTIVYEFFHCVQHLNTSPRNAFLKRIKRMHLAHHYHDEKANFGIIDFMWDRLFGTFRPEMNGRGRSATVFNLGYDDDVAARYPWVARLSRAKASAATTRSADQR